VIFASNWGVNPKACVQIPYEMEEGIFLTGTEKPAGQTANWGKCRKRPFLAHLYRLAPGAICPHQHSSGEEDRGTGLCLFTKRLEHGVFLWPSNVEPGGTLALNSGAVVDVD
jgi:hypothetical protein